MGATSAEEPRRYDSPIRREQAAETKSKIVEAGAALVHERASWDWSSLTVRAVAAKAGVHERTVHRHFATERELRAAIVQRLLVESGVSIDGVRLEEVPQHVEQLYTYLSSFSTGAGPRTEPAVDDIDTRRRAAILAMVRADAEALTQEQQHLAAAVLDVLWGVASYQRLSGGWDLDAADAARGVNWLIGLMTDAIKDGRGPE